MRLIARFAEQLPDGFEVIDIYDSQTQRHALPSTDPAIDSIAARYPAALWFERKMHDDFGIRIANAFDTRPLVHHERFPAVHPMRKEFTPGKLQLAEFKPYKYEAIEGEGIFQVGVGPIHAGIIEPGHFHFSQEGEAILHLEVRHFYKYRGIEKMMEGRDPADGFAIVEKISGNESVAYQIGYLNLLAQAADTTIDENIRKYNAILLELERIAHHLTDLGFIPNDAGFGAALAFCSMLAEDTRRMLHRLAGHRFGFGAVRGETKEIDKDALKKFVAHLRSEMEFFRDWIIDIPSLWDRLDTTGRLATTDAKKYGCVGVVARASGVALDRRDEELYRAHGWRMVTQPGGDVAARFKVRLEEVFVSLDIIEAMMDFAPARMTYDALRDGSYISYVESSLGELMQYLRIEDGKIARYFARDPSFINWQALHLMMHGNIIADFPLINKSCDLSYAGSDL